MSPTANSRVLFNEIPQGYPEAGKTVILDSSQEVDLETLNVGTGFLLKILALSVDPYMRNKMRDPSLKTNSPPYLIGEPIDGNGIAIVLRSNNSTYQVGEHVFGILPKKGETLFVTTGAGPVGSLVIQLAKLDGLKVIASAGSDDKVEFMKKIGADIAFNYKTQSTKDVLDKHGPINIYWDHVGGEVLDLALGAAAPFARFIEVGMISTYNSGAYPIKNIGAVLYKSLTMRGFIVGNMPTALVEDFYREIPPLVGSGKIQYLEDARRGLGSAGAAIVNVQTGKNFGKAVIVVADD